MEIFNNVAKQQNTQVQTEHKAALKQEPVHKPVQETKVQADVAKQSGKNIETEGEARELVESLNKALNPFSTSLRFGFDNSSEVFYVSVIDTNTADTIRRFPLEQASTLAAKMNEVTGIIFDEKG